MTEPIEVVEALESLAAKQPEYAKYARYYDGIHDTKFASVAWRDSFGKLLKRMNYNRCASVVDATSDRLQITSWQVEGSRGEDATPHEQAQAEWERCRGDYLQGLTHAESLRAGDAYVIVWPHRERPQEPVWRMQRGDSCMVLNDEETAEPQIGVKVWLVTRGPEKGRWRLTIYTDELITRWITRGKKYQEYPVKADDWEPYTADDQPSAVNPLGLLPLVHFPNNPQYQGECGISELRDVIPLQDGMNFSIWQLLVAGEFTAWPMRWATGVNPSIDDDTGEEVESLRGGIDRWIKIGNELAKIGQLPGSDLAPYIAVQDSWDEKISRVSHVPVHWLQGVSGQVSGETLKTAEAPFVGKLRDRQLAFGSAWEQAMALAMTIRGAQAELASPIWQSAAPRSETEIWSIALQQRAAGIPEEQIWREAGYSDDQIKGFKRLNEAAARQQVELLATTMARGEDDTFGESDEDAA